MRFIQVIVCVLSLNVVFGQFTTSSTPVQYPSGNAVVTGSSTVGYIVTLAAAGWAVGSDLALTSGTTQNFVTTLLSTGTAATSVGIVAVGGVGTSTAITCAPATAFGTSTNLEGKGPTAQSAAGTPASNTAVGACPVDILSIYSAAPATTSTTTTVGLVPSASNILLKVNVPVSWTIIPVANGAAGTACHSGFITVPGLAPVAFNGGSTAACEATNAKYFGPQSATAANIYTWSFYVATESSGKVCFQNQAQQASNPGCGTVGTKSSSIVAVLGAPLLLLSAILLN